MRFSIEKTIGAGFALAVLCLTLVGVVSFQSTLQLSRDAEKTQHSQTALTQLGALRSVVQDDEIGVHAYLIGGGETLLEPYRRARADYPGIERWLRRLTRDNPDQKQRFERLSERIGEHLLVSQAMVELMRTRGFETARAFEETSKRKQGLEVIRREISKMANSEQALLERRTSQTRSSTSATLGAIVLSTLLAFALVGGAACLIERDLKRRRQVEKELGAAYRTTQRQAVELRSIIDCMPEAVYFGTSKGITLSNENARRMFGVSLTNETGLELAQKAALRSPLTGELLGEETLQFNRALKGETVIEEIMATRADNGEVVHLRIACAPLMEEGEVIGAVAINSDITQRKQVEMALSQSEERYRRLMRLLPVPVYMCDREGFITFSNQKATELWGRETVPGFDRWCGSLRIFSPDGTPLALDVCPMAVALREGRSVRDEEILVERADGSRRWVLAHPDPIVDSSGEVIGAVNVLVDITPLRKTEEALRESAQRLRSHQEHSPIAVIEMDADLAITGWTRAAEKLFGWSAGEMQGKSIERIGGKIAQEWPRLESKVALNKEFGGEFRALCQHRTKAGEIIYCEWYNTVLVDADGRRSSVVARALDVTARKRSDDALRKLNVGLEARVLERTRAMSAAMQDLYEEMAERQRLEQQILKVSEHEQARLGQDLHDDLGQQLVGMAMLAQLLSNQLTAEAHPKAPQAAQLKTFLTDSIRTTRNLAKALYPVELEHGGLLLALADLAHRTQDLTRIRCAVRSDDAFFFEKETAIHLYRIVQESLRNAVRHGNPRNITIHCTARDGTPSIIITDDGKGFKQPRTKWAGLGLHLFQYRARAIGAEVLVGRGEKGGCEVICLMKSSRKKMFADA